MAKQHGQTYKYRYLAIHEKITHSTTKHKLPGNRQNSGARAYSGHGREIIEPY